MAAAKGFCLPGPNFSDAKTQIEPGDRDFIYGGKSGDDLGETPGETSAMQTSFEKTGDSITQYPEAVSNVDTENSEEHSDNPKLDGACSVSPILNGVHAHNSAADRKYENFVHLLLGLLPYIYKYTCKQIVYCLMIKVL